MKQVTICLSLICLFLAACNDSDSGGLPGGSITRNKGEVSDWQVILLGQEGHGGDAIVCFDIPIERALYKIDLRPQNSSCASGSCSDNISKKPNENGGASSGITWRMTAEGRQSIRSAKPLEQYLAERIASKKVLIDQLNQMSIEDGYKNLLTPFTKLPAPFNRLTEMHAKLGWLEQDGISSEYGLMDINDSGFLNEDEIDRTHCKELQAVVRRDNQLWYDADIVKHFDNAGRVLIQLHEEVYAWGKLQDEINSEIHGQPAHETSTNTRRLILKILDENIGQNLLNQNLKALGFSTMYWENMFNTPTPVGFYMDTDSCIAEQKFLKTFFAGGGYGRDFWLKVEMLFSSRYLKSSESWPTVELHHNFPDALSHMIELTMNSSSSSTFGTEITQLQNVFERAESCAGSF